MKKIGRFRLLALFMSMTLVGVLTGSSPTQAQSDTWSQPLLVFESQGRIAHPSLVADRYGQVHAFWTFVPDASTGINGRQIYYTRLDLSDAQPVDVVLSNDSFISLTSVGTDRDLSIMWDSSVFTQASISPALSALEWNSPSSLGTTYTQFALIAEPDNSLWMGYGDPVTNAVFVRHRDPETGNWESPLFVSNTSNPNAAPDAVRLSISSDGTLHIVWAEYQLPNGWPPLGVYYSRSTDGGQNWVAPRQMGGAGYNQPNIKVGFGQNVYMTSVGFAGLGGKYFSQSTDGGLTWSGTIPLTDLKRGGGSEGPLNMAVDSVGTLHTVFSLDSCVWYMRLDVNGWTDPECISNGVPSSHTEEPAMTLGLGNRLHVLWWANDRQLWYMTRQLSVPGQSPLPIPTKIIPTQPPATIPPTVIPTPTHIPDYGLPMDPSFVTQAGTWSMAAGTIPVLLLIAIVYLRRRFR